MKHYVSRRKFLSGLTIATPLGRALSRLDEPSPAKASPVPFPVVDFHAHYDKDFPLEKAVRLADERGVKLGVVEHAGFGEAIGSDRDLRNYIETLAPYPVFKGVQAEGMRWTKCFSKELVAQLDYVLSDALTCPDEKGRLVRIWLPDVQIEDKQGFMERYVDFTVRVISEQPIDILANPTFLPGSIAMDYDALWTEERIKKIIDAALKHDVAIEINSRFNIPSQAFIAVAKRAGVTFSFGSNSHREEMGRLDYSMDVARHLGLTAKDIFTPKPAARKRILQGAFA